MTLIVVEGEDGSGKSTLVNELAHLSLDNGARVKHRGPLKQHPLIEYVHDLLTYSPDRDTIICDRWHVGELIYGPLYRGKTELTIAMRRYVEMFLISRGAWRIVMDTPYDTVVDRLVTRGEDFLRPEHLHLVQDFYAEYAEQEGWERLTCDYELEDLRRVLRDAKSQARRASRLAQFPSYVGPLRPVSLLVAVTTPVSGLETGFSTAVPPVAGSQGHFLLTALEQAEVPRTYGIATATNTNLLSLWMELGRPRTIALGTGSQQVARSSNLPINTVVASPLAWRGQPATDLVTYGNQLKDAIAHA